MLDIFWHIWQFLQSIGWNGISAIATLISAIAALVVAIDTRQKDESHRYFYRLNIFPLARPGSPEEVRGTGDERRLMSK